MKYLFIFLLLGIGFSLSSKAQNANSSESTDPITKGIQQAESFIESGNKSKALDAAESAFKLAKDAEEWEYAAFAMNAKGRAYLMSGKKGDKGNYDKAKAAFIKSKDYIEKYAIKNNTLLLSNYQKLREIAIMTNDNQGQVEAESRIGQIETGDQNKAVDTKKLNEKQLRAQIDALGKENEELQTEKQKAMEEQSKMAESEQMLNQTLLEKELAYNKLNERQIRQRLMINEQNAIMDSLAHANEMKNLDIKNKELALNEKEATEKLYLAFGVIGLVLTFFILFAFFRQKRFNSLLEQKNELITTEKHRSDELLLNILPAVVAKELIETGTTKARYFDKVTVMFSDFVNFSKISEMLSPQELVSELDYCFRGFDEIVHKYGLEKIKTIGDAYMCVSGLPEPRRDNAARMIHAAMEMRHFLSVWNHERRAKGLIEFEARFGIHTGPVVAGVVGSKKFAFDIWGDAVNLASRMESSGEKNRINISGDTYAMIKDEFTCEHRGKIQAKNKGEIDMYFVEYVSNKKLGSGQPAPKELNS